MRVTTETWRPAGVFAAVIGLTCCQANAAEQVATFKLTRELTVSVIRNPSHPSLPEYERTACISAGGKRLACWKLFPDTGGTQRINVYHHESKWVFLQDRITSYKIDLAGKKLAEVNPRSVSGTYVGCFNQDATGAWRFVPAKETSEEKFVGDDR